MDALRLEFRRLVAGYARAVGEAQAGRLHLRVVAVACLLAFVHRAVVRIPLLTPLEELGLPLLLAGVGLYVLGPLLRLGLERLARPTPTSLARDLDDRFGWQDQADTAVALVREDAPGPLAGLVAAQVGGRLRELDPAELVRAGRSWRRLRLALVFLFVALFLLPGVDGLLGLRGGGRQGEGDVGSAGVEDPFGAPRPMKADFWIQGFIENPLPVEPLPEEPKAEKPSGADAKQPKVEAPKSDASKGDHR